MHIELRVGMMYTPEMARQRGAILLRERLSHDIKIILYREDTHFIVTTSHVVMTISAIRRVGEWALLHS